MQVAIPRVVTFRIFKNHFCFSEQTIFVYIRQQAYYLCRLKIDQFKRYFDFNFVKLYMRQIETRENTTLVFVSFYIHFINLSKIIFLFTVSNVEIFSEIMILHCHFTFLKRISEQFAINFTIALTKINTMQKLFIYF